MFINNSQRQVVPFVSRREGSVGARPPETRADTTLPKKTADPATDPTNVIQMK